MRREYGTIVDRILNLLAENGPMTRAEIIDDLELPRDSVSAVVCRLHTKLAKTPKRIHIVRYDYEMEGQRRYPRAVFALGDGVDAKKPNRKAVLRENKRRYTERQHKKNKMNFVFNLAKPRREYQMGSL
mgnify:CR=1 FL=1